MPNLPCRSLRQAETAVELLNAMNELRQALAVEKVQFSHQSVVWEQQLRTCVEGNASIEEVLQVLGDLRSTAKQWIKPKQKENLNLTECSKAQKVLLLSPHLHACNHNYRLLSEFSYAIA